MRTRKFFLTIASTTVLNALLRPLLPQKRNSLLAGLALMAGYQRLLSLG